VGIAELRQLCAKHPGSLVLIDSFAKVSEKLGIDENSREAAEVLTDIERACIVSRCTPLMIYHNGKSAGRAGVVDGGALHGNGAIRANASQVAVLTRIDQDNPKDPRRRLVTEGRGGGPLPPSLPNPGLGLAAAGFGGAAVSG
jgi:RecA-family ATPase